MPCGCSSFGEVSSTPRITKPGESGAAVLAWQKWLTANGFPVSQDSVHGPETEAATQAYLQTHGEGNGSVGAGSETTNWLLIGGGIVAVGILTWFFFNERPHKGSR